MQFLFLFLFFFLGHEVLRGVGDFKPLFRIGAAFPVALGFISIELFLADIVGIPINNLGFLITLILVQFGAIQYALFKKAGKVELDIFEFRNIQFRKEEFSPTFLLLLVLLIILVIATISKGLFYPVYIYDSLVGGYDAIARSIAAVGSINNPIFDPNNLLISARSTYPPFCPISFSIAYTFGYASSKIINVLFFCSMAVSFFALTRDYIGQVGAALLTLLLLLSPEYLAFSSLSSSNPIATYYVGMGLILLFIWSDKKESAYFTGSILMLSLAVFTRSEAIVFIAGGWIILLLQSIQEKAWTSLLRRSILYFSFPLLLFIAWQSYLQIVLQITSSQPISLIPNLDIVRMKLLWTKIIALTFTDAYYGYTLYIFALFILLSLKNIVQGTGNFSFLLSILLSWFLLLMIYNQIKADYTITHAGDWINSGYKRTFFFFLPLMYFYAASTMVSQKWLKKWLV